uniref:Uncharacterized protein n=1 Tax=Kalanchoe fedtschenkoi TaxID=63787 RepID=A0A7N1A2V3_KALFE
MAAGKYQVRSISLPSRSHPTSVRTEQELTSLKSWGSSSSGSSSNEVCSLLAGLEEAYKCADELVSMQSACEIKRRAIDSWFDGSVKLLDVCSSSRETMLMAKGHVQDIQSAMRRRSKGDSSIQKTISGYLSFRKQMTKSATKMIALLKQMNHASATTSSLDDDSSRLIKVLRDVTEVTVSVFESLLTFLAAPSCAAKTSNKWSMVSRLMMTKRAAVRDDKAVNEFACVDAVMFKSGSSQVSPFLASAQVVLERLEALEVAIRGIDDRLGSMFMCLVTLRVSLLNRMSTFQTQVPMH